MNEEITRDTANAALLLDEKIEERILLTLQKNPEFIASMMGQHAVQNALAVSWEFRQTVSGIVMDVCKEMLTRLGDRIKPTYPTYTSNNTNAPIW